MRQWIMFILNKFVSKHVDIKISARFFWNNLYLTRYAQISPSSYATDLDRSIGTKYTQSAIMVT